MTLIDPLRSGFVRILPGRTVSAKMNTPYPEIELTLPPNATVDEMEFLLGIDLKLTDLADRVELDKELEAKLPQDLAFMSKLVKLNGLALRYADPALKKNKDLVLLAVRQNGWALKFAGLELLQDPEVVLAAVRKFSRAPAMRYRIEELLGQPKQFLQMVKSNPSWLLYARDLRCDQKFMLEALAQNLEALKKSKRTCT